MITLCFYDRPIATSKPGHWGHQLINLRSGGFKLILGGETNTGIRYVNFNKSRM